MKDLEPIAAQEAQFPPADEMSPAALGAFQKAEIAKWWPMIKAAHITGMSGGPNNGSAPRQKQGGDI